MANSWSARLSQEVKVHFSQTQFFMVLELLAVHIPLYFTLFFEQRHLVQQTQQGLNCHVLRTGYSSSPLLGIYKPTSIPLKLVSPPLLFVLKLVPGHFICTVYL